MCISNIRVPFVVYRTIYVCHGCMFICESTTVYLFCNILIIMIIHKSKNCRALCILLDTSNQFTVLHILLVQR